MPNIVYGQPDSKINLTKGVNILNHIADVGVLWSNYTTAPSYWSLAKGGLTKVTWTFVPKIGQKIAVIGQTSGRQYDFVKGLVCSETPGCGRYYTEKHITSEGDSGGPWFSSGGAAGIHNGGVVINNTERSYFTSVDRAQQIIGVKVKIHHG